MSSALSAQATGVSPTREDASRELLTALMEVKGWLRETSQWIHDDRGAAALMVLALLERCGPCRVSDLAEVSRVDASVVSRQVSSLEKDGLVERSPDPADGRAHRLSITGAGAGVLREGRARLVDVVADRLTGWQPADITTFARTLRRLLADLTTRTTIGPTTGPTP